MNSRLTYWIFVVLSALAGYLILRSNPNLRWNFTNGNIYDTNAESKTKIDDSNESFWDENHVIQRLLNGEVDVTCLDNAAAQDLLSRQLPMAWKWSELGYCIRACRRVSELIQVLVSIEIALVKSRQRTFCYISLHVVDPEAAQAIREAVKDVKFCDLKLVEDVLSDDLKEKSKQIWAGHHWNWTMHQIFEVRQITGDVIFVEDDIALSPDHRDYSLFAISAKSRPHAFAEPLRNMLERIHYITFGPTNGAKDFQFENPELSAVIIRYTPYYFFFEISAHIFNSTFYHLIKPYMERVIMAEYYYEEIEDVPTGLVKLAEEIGLYDPIQMSPSFGRKWHIGSTSTIHEYNDENPKEEAKVGFRKWENIESKSPWSRDKGAPGLNCNSLECHFYIRPYWTNPQGAPCRGYDHDIEESCRGWLYLSYTKEDAVCESHCNAHDNPNVVNWTLFSKDWL